MSLTDGNLVFEEDTDSIDEDERLCNEVQNLLEA